jgi:hypothetical protein
VAFDAATYQIEDPISFKNDSGVLNERECAVDNIIRYRFVDGTNSPSSDVVNDVETGIQGKPGRKVSSTSKCKMVNHFSVG